MAEEVKKDEDWMQKKWRPAMGWMYMLVCTCDMVIFPVLWSILQASLKQPVTQWNPLTLQGAGLFHLAMGAVLGIAAFGRTQEKIAGTATNAPTIGGTPNGFTQSPSNTPAFGSSPAGFGAPTGGFGSPAPTSTFGTSAPSMAKPTPMSTPAGFGAGLDPSDPPTRNTRNDGLDS